MKTPKVKTPDFKALDAMWEFHYKKDLIAIAEEREFSYISQCVHELYYAQKKCIREVAEIMGVSKNSIIIWMKRWEFKLRSQGGNNSNPLLKDPKYIAKIFKLKGKMDNKLVAKKFNCCVVVVNNIWNEKHCTQKKD